MPPSRFSDRRPVLLLRGKGLAAFDLATGPHPAMLPMGGIHETHHVVFAV